MRKIVLATGLLGAALASSSALAECQVEQGKKQFNRCIACHSVAPGEHKMGPSLHGLMGRKIASVEQFSYSPAMKNQDFIWNDETLDQFLAKPTETVPGTVMPFAGIKKQKQRDAIICYLNSLED